MRIVIAQEFGNVAEYNEKWRGIRVVVRAEVAVLKSEQRGRPEDLSLSPSKTKS